MPTPTVVFLCTGNTCRSPLVMALARCRWGQAVQVLSAGLQAMNGQPAADNACVVAIERGADLTDHGSRMLDGELIREADWIIGMTRSHVAMLNARLSEDSEVKLGLLGAPGDDWRHCPTPASVEEVDDPYGGSLETYRKTADQLTRLLALWDPYVRDDQGKD